MLADMTDAVFVPFPSLGLSIWNKQFGRRRGRICFNSWFWGAHFKVSWPPALGQNVMAEGPCSEEGLTSWQIKSRENRVQEELRKYTLEIPHTATYPKAPISPKTPPQADNQAFSTGAL